MNTFIQDLKKYHKVLFCNKRFFVSMILGLLIMSFVEISQAKTINMYTLFAISSSVAGAWYVLNVNYRHNFAYVFGIWFSFSYGIIAYRYAIYGDFFTNIFITLPMCVYGLYKAYNHKNDVVENNKINKLVLNKAIKMVYLYTILMIASMIILTLIGDSQPIKDSFTSVSTLFGMYLMVNNHKEQWIIWFCVNLVSIIIWYINYQSSGANPSLVFMWMFYLINGVVGWCNWSNEYNGGR